MHIEYSRAYLHMLGMYDNTCIVRTLMLMEFVEAANDCVAYFSYWPIILKTKLISCDDHIIVENKICAYLSNFLAQVEL